VPGSTEIGKIEQLFDMEIADDDFTTIAGLVISEHGTVPNVGERLTIGGLEVEVLEADERRINRLRVKAKPEIVTDETNETQKQISAGKKN
jgi:Mg2+/Co2+ transporter CorC